MKLDKDTEAYLYNQAIVDAQVFFAENPAELAGVQYEPEFDFWKKR